MDVLLIRLLIILVGVIVALALYSYIKARLQYIIVMEYQQALKYVKGKYTGLVGPGKYRISPYKISYFTVDMRPQQINLPGQEVMSQDNVSIKVSLTGEFTVVDPAFAVNKIVNYHTSLYQTIQIKTREIIGTKNIDEILEQRNEVSSMLFELSKDKAKEIGLELKFITIRDITFPGDLKNVFVQVIKARKEGLAILEKARGEQAALRNLANAAKMLEENPNLFKLRLIQSLGQSTGNTISINIDDKKSC
ncbi:MAG: slipin family protein [Candidatus Coatesbacteria bacterium]|nr:slipin family protein [Candidatus Coatesbacteria bacterium]